MEKPIQVLVLEDREIDAETVIRELRRAGFDPLWKRVETEADYLAGLESAPDLILSDYSVPQFDGLRAAQLLRESGRDIPFILISATIGDEAAVNVMKAGATDYLLKDRIGRLGSAVERALEERRVRVERLQAEETLRRSEISLAAAQAVAQVGSWETDLATLAMTWSAEAFRIFGTSPDQFEPTHEGFLEFVHPEDRVAVNEAFTESFTRQDPCMIEHRLLMPDGRIKTVEERWHVIMDEQGRPLRATGTCQDITERKLSEEMHRKRTEELERFHRLSVGRELRMIELKKEVNTLAAKLGLPEPYPAAGVDETALKRAI